MKITKILSEVKKSVEAIQPNIPTFATIDEDGAVKLLVGVPKGEDALLHKVSHKLNEQFCESLYVTEINGIVVCFVGNFDI